MSVIPELSLALGVLWSKFYLDSLNGEPPQQQYLELKQSASSSYQQSSPTTTHLQYRCSQSNHQLSQQLMEILESRIKPHHLSISFQQVINKTRPNNAFSIIFAFEVNGHLVAHYDGVDGLLIDLFLLDQTKVLLALREEIDRELVNRLLGIHRIERTSTELDPLL